MRRRMYMCRNHLSEKLLNVTCIGNILPVEIKQGIRIWKETQVKPLLTQCSIQEQAGMSKMSLHIYKITSICKAFYSSAHGEESSEVITIPKFKPIP